MALSILLAYATSYGSTEEVANSMAETLRGSGYEVSVQSAKKVKTLNGFQAVILGAPLYMFRWHQDARRFLSKHRAALSSMPAAIFALGPFHNKEDELKSAREQLDKELGKYVWLKPAAIQVLVGKFDPNKLRFPFSLIGPLKKMPASDERDWDAIKTWTKTTAEGMQGK